MFNHESNNNSYKAVDGAIKCTYKHLLISIVKLCGCIFFAYSFVSTSYADLSNLTPEDVEQIQRQSLSQTVLNRRARARLSTSVQSYNDVNDEEITEVVTDPLEDSPTAPDRDADDEVVQQALELLEMLLQHK